MTTKDRKHNEREGERPVDTERASGRAYKVRPPFYFILFYFTDIFRCPYSRPTAPGREKDALAAPLPHPFTPTRKTRPCGRIFRVGVPFISPCSLPHIHCTPYPSPPAIHFHQTQKTFPNGHIFCVKLPPHPPLPSSSP